MNRYFISFLFLLLTTYYLLLTPTFAFTCNDPADPTNTRCASCDLCGYCLGGKVPGNWTSCRNCLYPMVTAEATENLTLKIDPVNGQAIAPATGVMYTMLGCIGTSTSAFTTGQAQGTVIQTLLTNLVFSMVGGVALLYLIYGAFVILTSQNEPERLNYGKRIIYGSVIGVIFSLSSIFIVNLIANGVLKIPGFGQ